METFSSAVSAPLALRAIINAGLLVTIFQITADVLSLVFLVFYTIG
jgi:hypothetical protein